MADTRTPLHLFENTANRWVDTAAWPPSPTARSFRFDTTGTLAQASGSLTYTTPPLTGVLDGPSNLTVYATSTAPEVELSATLNVLAADGTVVKQADGILLGSQRKLDTSTSWYGTGHTLLSPSHPFTQASQQPVPVGRLTRYDIPLLANFTEIQPGQRLQVVLTGQPPANLHLQVAPTPQERAALAGGVYTIQNATLSVPLAAPNQFRTSDRNWGPSS